MRPQVTVVTAVVLWTLSLTGLPFGTARAGAEVPPGWTCNPVYYADGYCDCGCGALDPDCTDATVGSCEFCGEFGACDQGDQSCSTIDPTQNWLCVPPPPGWTCNPTYYGTNDGCDCGCGALDPDCSDATVGSCEFCGDIGACDQGDQSCSTIDPNNNWLCGAKGLGLACISGTDCISTFCASGVCCNAPCSSPGQSCNQPGSAGFCRAEISGVPAASQRGIIALCVLLAAVGFSGLLSVRYRRRS